MRLLLATSELHPYSKSGGLADMVGALAKALGRAGHRVGVVTPLHRGIRGRFAGLLEMDYRLAVPVGAEWMEGRVFTLEPSPGVTLYFVDHPECFDRPGLYNEAQVDYPDNARRYIFFSKCVAHLARFLTWAPEVVHVHDWQTGLVPLLIRHQAAHEGWQAAPRSCLTIHNLAYQGNFPRADYALTNLPPQYFNPDGAEFHGQLSCLKAGIAYADVLTTVSPRYAREITTPEFGCGLDGVLRSRAASLIGILNGVDYEEWNTAQNPQLRHPYSVRSLRGKAETKQELQAEMNLPQEAGIPLFANITRLTDQKGVDLQLGALEEMLSADLQFVLLGSGDPRFQDAYRDLARRHPGKVAVRVGFDQGLSHRIEAGADFYIMPSRFEPCGLNQMYSLRYGTVPIVRATGGLDDSVIDPAEDAGRANGIKFRELSVRALAKALRKALVLYQSPALFARFRRNGMKADFSWEQTCAHYLPVYQGRPTAATSAGQPKPRAF
jgi:starch synthase